jgi:hypothetical protein
MAENNAEVGIYNCDTEAEISQSLQLRLAEAK